MSGNFTVLERGHPGQSVSVKFSTTKSLGLNATQSYTELIMGERLLVVLILTIHLVISVMLQLELRKE